MGSLCEALGRRASGGFGPRVSWFVVRSGLRRAAASYGLQSPRLYIRDELFEWRALRVPLHTARFSYCERRVFCMIFHNFIIVS